jgi:hypothetical protein
VCSSDLRQDRAVSGYSYFIRFCINEAENPESGRHGNAGV